jgi:cellobiose phosphorylase
LGVDPGGAPDEIESGVRTKISDDRLWLCFATARYLEETGDLSALELAEPFVDDPAPHSLFDRPAPFESFSPRYKRSGTGTVGSSNLWEHCRRALDLALAELSPRGLPLIGGGDWNDGLNAVGLDGVGESVWLGHFLHGLLRDFSGFAGRRGEQALAERYSSQAAALREAINRVAWDGEWYWRASADDGALIGSHEDVEGKIFLNAQTWAILAGTAPPERARQAWKSVEKWLLKDFGPLLLFPAYKKPDAGIGYLTRYAPGVRENGGVYTHAATWAVLAACKLGLRDKAYEIYRRICPPNRSADIERYQAEPYVTAGNVDGPDSPHFGRGGWTWYTGSAQWLLRATLDGLFGLQATIEGLRISPCLPPEWEGCRVKRIFRGSLYEIEYRNRFDEPLEDSKGSSNRTGAKEKSLTLDGVPVDGDTLPPPTRPIHQVVVSLGLDTTEDSK